MTQAEKHRLHAKTPAATQDSPAKQAFSHSRRHSRCLRPTAQADMLLSALFRGPSARCRNCAWLTAASSRQGDGVIPHEPCLPAWDWQNGKGEPPVLVVTFFHIIVWDAFLVCQSLQLEVAGQTKGYPANAKPREAMRSHAQPMFLRSMFQDELVLGSLGTCTLSRLSTGRGRSSRSRCHSTRFAPVWFF